MLPVLLKLVFCKHLLGMLAISFMIPILTEQMAPGDKVLIVSGGALRKGKAAIIPIGRLLQGKDEGFSFLLIYKEDSLCSKHKDKGSKDRGLLTQN